ncbi:hypothetical protein BH10PSE14_BH10PSE14_28770 [soil metagenome]
MIDAGLIESILIVFAVFLLIAVGAGAKGIVFQISAYKKFKRSMDRIEQASVHAIKSKKLPGGMTLRMVGRLRVSEIMTTSLGETFDAQIVRCFGGMFLKEESIEEAVARLRVSCIIALGALVIGALVVFVGDPAGPAKLAGVPPHQFVPRFMGILLSSEWVLWAELLMAGFTVLTLIDGGRTVRRLNEELA